MRIAQAIQVQRRNSQQANGQDQERNSDLNQ